MAACFQGMVVCVLFLAEELPETAKKTVKKGGERYLN